MPTSETVYPPLNVLGLMSGTSMDSIDAACVQIQMASLPTRLVQWKLLGTHSQELPSELRAKLFDVLQEPTVSLDTLGRLNLQMGRAFAETAQTLIETLKQQGISVDLIASHGQTLYHQPPTNNALGFTLQIGEPSLIAEQTGIEVAADFRPGDMAAGGHGAPLVPFADMLLFQDVHEARAVQNIGGIANLTALPALSDTTHHPMAFDTGPGNMMIDAAMEALFHQPYDASGNTARRGQCSEALLAELMSDPYFKLPPPKSTGRELFGKQRTQQILETWQSQLSREEIVHTLTMFTVSSMVQAYTNFVLPQLPVKQMLVGGGGVRNTFLMEQLESNFAPLGINVKPVDDVGLSSQYKEAIAFAFLGYARKMGLPSNVPSCTGAKHPVSLGALWTPAH